VALAVTTLRQRGVEFVETAGAKVTHQGAITRNVMHSVVFELVHDVRDMHNPSVQLSP
jgi:hypothetical protein